jgi:hypothetical protein
MKIMFLVERYPPEIDVSAIRIHEMVSSFTKFENTAIKVVVYNPLYENDSKNKLAISDNFDIVRYKLKYFSKIAHVLYMINPITLLCWIYIAIKEHL